MAAKQHAASFQSINNLSGQVTGVTDPPDVGTSIGDLVRVRAAEWDETPLDCTALWLGLSPKAPQVGWFADFYVLSGTGSDGKRLVGPVSIPLGWCNIATIQRILDTKESGQ